jgi:hypothetical protein
MAADVLLVSIGATAGLRRADQELADSLRRAGATVVVATTARPRPLRTMALSDLAFALAARRAARRALEAHAPRAVVYSTTTAALLWPRPGAVRFDAPAAGNRPGRHGLWQRPLERRRLREATVLVPWAPRGLAEAPPVQAEAIVVPVPVEPSGPPAAERDLAALTYGAHAEKKGLDRVLAAWASARRAGEELVVTGVGTEEARGAGVDAPDSVRFAGLLAADEYRALLRRARVYVTAPRREDHGLAQLEALADGVQLVTTAAPGPYAALALARELDPRLVGDDLASALRIALDDPAPDYERRAREAVAPLARDAVDRVVAERLLPTLLG